MNDGSSDDTLEKLQYYAAKDSRIVVFDLPRGGVGRARNFALDHCEAKYVSFLDSDDFIHPQTLEFAVGLLERDGTDIATFYRKSWYRNVQVRLRRLFGLDTMKWKPRSYRHIYDLSKVETVRTDDILTHCSCGDRHPMPWPVKHSYTMLQVYRREVVQDVKLLEHIFIEDLPWWSEVILTPHSATISKLPLYYYYPNRLSIINTVKRVRKSAFVLEGLSYAWKLYSEKATPERFAIWRRQIMWPMLEHLSKRLGRLRTEEDRKNVRERIREVADLGVLDVCDNPRAERTRKALLKF